MKEQIVFFRKRNTSLSLSQKYKAKVDEINIYLKGVKEKFDKYDEKHSTRDERISFVEKEKDEIFKMLNIHFKEIWSFVENLSDFEYAFHKKYLFDSLNKIIFASEINKYIYEKPLGYPGDFVMMLYLYDYCDKYLGDSSFSFLLNRYTCDTPVAYSVRSRKVYFKDQIGKLVKGSKTAKILNIACGACREITELIEEDAIKNKIELVCLDFEKKAFDSIRNKMNSIPDNPSKSNIKMELINSNFSDLILKRNVRDHLSGQDLIYSAGLFDYLSDRLASKLLSVLFKMLNPGGKIIVSNASLSRSSHRAYYEMVGDWVLKYRDEANMVKWTERIKENKELSFEKPRQHCVFDLLCIKKPLQTA